ncbi:hypothetical protein ACWGI1_16990 [Streptomyces sp. NPDC054835]
MTLGEKILHELGAAETVDTLTRWLAHHVAGLITEAEHAQRSGTPEEAASAAERCRQAILDLWAQRTAWPRGWPPPGAKKMAELLSGIDTPAFGLPQGNKFSALQRLHYRVLRSLTDEETASEPGHDVEDLLESYGLMLDADERDFLELYAGLGDRAATATQAPRAEPSTDDAATDEQTGRTPQARQALDLAHKYHETVRSLLADETKDGPTQPD